MNENTGAGPGAAEAARIVRTNTMWMEARTIADRYRADREACRNRVERAMVWRTYARALLDEQADRIAAGVGIFAQRERQNGFVRWRASWRDNDMAVRYRPAWRAMSDADLLDLEVALIRARYSGAGADHRVTD
ncbi:hypothetical protein [uncultured Sphingomonas sp.]|uniref:hypothetical protein n=1 Tax=uncultured Sphingomonas sp. TaxID=158754 RepID=UPI0025D396BF|nr:hypothetical protein [uncultured Sphingomonas sp.]